MDIVFADAFYWIALANPADGWYDSAKQFDLENRRIRLVTTDEVLIEFLNYYSGAGAYRRSLVSAMCMNTRSHPNIEVIPQSRESFDGGLEFFIERADKGYSLTDCISMLTMKRRAIKKVLTHDRHFAQEGFEVLF
jgi:predicted nucleic acid-binding protein